MPSDPAEDELGRQVSDDERRLWTEVTRRAGDVGDIPAVEAGKHLGIHEERTRQILRTWENDGLIITISGANRCRLTDYGRGFDFDPEER